MNVCMWRPINSTLSMSLDVLLSVMMVMVIVAVVSDVAALLTFGHIKEDTDTPPTASEATSTATSTIIPL